MKFGLALPYNISSSLPELAQNAEAAGWDGIFLGDAIWCEDPMISLAAAAVVTRSIRLGTMLIPVPLRSPWKISSEAAALDRLSNGRFILGLGTGAVWMGWNNFPDVTTQTKTRGEMLDECIDILTLLDQRQPFDYDGRHYHLKLSTLDPMHYPPAPVQQPRVPLWVPLVLPGEKSMQRALKCDGVFVERINAQKQPVEVTPQDICALKAHVLANRTLTRPFEIVVSGQSADLEAGQCRQQTAAWQEAGATWWVEALWGAPPATVLEIIRKGPDRLKSD